MAGLYFAVFCMCVPILMCAPVHNGENQSETTNKLLNNTLESNNTTFTPCQTKLIEAFSKLANFKQQKMDLQTWMTKISLAIVQQQQLMNKLHIDIDSFLGWTHGPNGTLQFPMINESFVSNETDGIDDIEPWDDDFRSARRTGWLRREQNTMTEGQILPESPSEPNPGLVEPLEVVDYEGEGGLSTQTDNENENKLENDGKEVADNEQEAGEMAVSKEITEAAEKPEEGNEADVTEGPDNTKPQEVTKTVKGKTNQPSAGLSKPSTPQHEVDIEESQDPLEPTEQEQIEKKLPEKKEQEQLDQKELEQPQRKDIKQKQETTQVEKEKPEIEQVENEQVEKEQTEIEQVENEQVEKEQPENKQVKKEQPENEQVENEQEENELETEQPEEENKLEALQIDEGRQEKTGSKHSRKLMGLEFVRPGNAKPEVHPAESRSESTQTVQDVKKRIDACMSGDNRHGGFNELHGIERYTEQNSVSQRYKMLECVLSVMKGMPVARQNILMSRLQRFLETMEHWEK